MALALYTKALEFRNRKSFGEWQKLFRNVIAFLMYVKKYYCFLGASALAAQATRYEWRNKSNPLPFCLVSWKRASLKPRQDQDGWKQTPPMAIGRVLAKATHLNSWTRTLDIYVPVSGRGSFYKNADSSSTKKAIDGLLRQRDAILVSSWPSLYTATSNKSTLEGTPRPETGGSQNLCGGEFT